MPSTRKAPPQEAVNHSVRWPAEEWAAVQDEIARLHREDAHRYNPSDFIRYVMRRHLAEMRQQLGQVA